MLIARKLPVLLLLSTLTTWTQSGASENLTDYEKAVNYYREKKYFQAEKLFDEIALDFLGHVDEANIYFYRGQCSFHLKDYEQSAAMFEYFSSTFPADSRVEEAIYMQALAYARMSPDFMLDQTTTERSIVLFEDYLQEYSDGVHVYESQQQLEILRQRLMKKELEAARVYHKLGKPKAALIVIKNLLKDFESACYSEELAYLKVQVQYQYFQKYQEQEAAHKILQYCRQFLANYPQSTHAAAVKTTEKSIQKTFNSK